MPEFLALYNLKGGEGFIKYYKGINSIKTVYESLLKDAKPHEDYSAIGAQQEWYNLNPEYFRDFIRRRAKLNIKIRLLMQDSKKSPANIKN